MDVGPVLHVDGGRVPDLTVWAKGRPPRPARSNYAGTDGLMLAVEVSITTVHRHTLDLAKGG
jgi:hypothetical protein